MKYKPVAHKTTAVPPNHPNQHASASCTLNLLLFHLGSRAHSHQNKYDEQQRGSHDQPVNGMRPGQPFNWVLSSQMGLGSPLITEEVEEPEVSEGVDGGSGVAWQVSERGEKGEGWRKVNIWVEGVRKCARRRGKLGCQQGRGTDKTTATH